MSEDSTLMLSMTVYKAVSIFAGLAFAFMGYKLFVYGVFQTGGELHTNWNNRSLVLKRAAPGTFFALFGTTIVCISLWRGLTFGPGKGAAGGTPVPSLSGFDAPADEARAPMGPASEKARQTVLGDIAALNRFEDDLVRQQKKGGDRRANLTVDDGDRTIDLIDRAKAALMLSVWAPDWGDAEEFRKWASHAPGYPYSVPPPGIARAAGIFKGSAP
jgi:hypothetical protein